MEKIWFIAYQGRQEGPYSFSELKRDSRVTPDTFVWKEGFDTWKRVRDVPELKVLFQEEHEESSEEERAEGERKKQLAQEELVLEMGGPPNIFWIFIAVIIIAYLLGQLLWR